MWESRHMLTYAKTKSKAGSKVDGLWTAKWGHVEKPLRESVSLNPNVRYIENKNKTKNGQQ